MPYALIASRRSGTAESLAALLSVSHDVRLLTDGEALLREAQELSPEVIVLHEDLEGPLRAAEVAARLTLRPELRATWVVAVGPREAAGG
ncbi:MAG TPA: hypothetical protein VNT60_08635, partial [Deinococcales bacterium]|nr:hypothetical protein [Deinococcales bacterium]